MTAQTELTQDALYSCAYMATVGVNGLTSFVSYYWTSDCWCNLSCWGPLSGIPRPDLDRQSGEWLMSVGLFRSPADCFRILHAEWCSGKGRDPRHWSLPTAQL